MTDQIIITESTLAHFERGARVRIEGADFVLRHLVPATAVLVVLLLVGAVVAWAFSVIKLAVVLGCCCASPVGAALIARWVLVRERRRAEEALALIDRTRQKRCDR